MLIVLLLLSSCELHHKGLLHLNWSSKRLEERWLVRLLLRLMLHLWCLCRLLHVLLLHHRLLQICLSLRHVILIGHPIGQVAKPIH